MLRTVGVLVVAGVVVAVLLLLQERQTVTSEAIEDCIARGLAQYQAEGRRDPGAENDIRLICERGPQAFLGAN